MIDYKDVETFSTSATSSLSRETADTDTIAVTKIDTPFGELLAGASTQGICLLEFTDTQRLDFQLPRLEKNFSCNVVNGTSPYFDQLDTGLKAYFSGSVDAFKDIALDMKGTEFQMKVWDALRNIPYGETRSYQEQAQAINNPKAVRAVASANRNNRISILVPCHRVISKKGTMAGYGGGIWRKEYLLELEGSL